MREEADNMLMNIYRIRERKRDKALFEDLVVAFVQNIDNFRSGGSH